MKKDYILNIKAKEIIGPAIMNTNAISKEMVKLIRWKGWSKNKISIEKTYSAVILGVEKHDGTVNVYDTIHRKKLETLPDVDTFMYMFFTEMI